MLFCFSCAFIFCIHFLFCCGSCQLGFALSPDSPFTHRLEEDLISPVSDQQSTAGTETLLSASVYRLLPTAQPLEAPRATRLVLYFALKDLCLTCSCSLPVPHSQTLWTSHLTPWPHALALFVSK